MSGTSAEPPSLLPRERLGRPTGQARALVALGCLCVSSPGLHTAKEEEGPVLASKSLP